MASRREINIALRTALDAAGLHASRAQFRAMSKSIRESMKEASDSSRKHMADIKAGFDMLVGGMRTAARAISTVLKSAFNFETQTTQFKTLIGNIDAAKAHMADLKALGDTPPFSLDEFAKASRQLMVMTDGALGFKESLKLVGDVAAATGQPIETVGHAVGRLYAFIRDGQPLSRAVMELRNMGVITPEVASRLDEMQKAGAKNVEIWEEVEKQLARYNGAMAETEKTGNGLMGAIKSRWDSVVRSFGQALEGEAKGGLEKLLKAMKGLEEDGTLAVWAEKVKSAISVVVDKCAEAVEAIKAIGKAISWMYERSGMSDVWHTVNSRVQGVASGVGTLVGGGSLSDAAAEYKRASMEEIAKGYYGGKLMEKGMFGDEGKRVVESMKAEQIAAAEAVARAKEKAAAEAAKKAAEAEIAENRRAEEEKARIRTQLAEAQAKQDEIAAKEQAEKVAEIHKKAVEERDSLEREYAAKRDKYVRENAEHAGRYAVGVSETGDVIYKTITEAAAKASAAAKAAEFDASEVGKTYLKDLQALSELVGQTAAEKPDEPENPEKPEKNALEQVKAAQKVSAELRAAKLQEIADQKRAEEKAKADELRLQREAINKRIALMREANAKELAEIDKRIAAEREKERKWEEEAKGMREAAAGGGKGLGDFFRNRRDKARDERREARNRAVALARVNREIADLERRGGPDGRRLSDAQRERLKELRDFVNRQDPKNNPAAKAAAELEKRKLAAIEKTNKEIDTLRKSIEARTVL